MVIVWASNQQNVLLIDIYFSYLTPSLPTVTHTQRFLFVSRECANTCTTGRHISHDTEDPHDTLVNVLKK